MLIYILETKWLNNLNMFILSFYLCMYSLCEMLNMSICSLTGSIKLWLTFFLLLSSLQMFTIDTKIECMEMFISSTFYVSQPIHLFNLSLLMQSSLVLSKIHVLLTLGVISSLIDYIFQTTYLLCLHAKIEWQWQWW